MANRWIDSFSWQNGNADLARRYTSGSGNTLATGGRRGQRCVAGVSSLYKALPAVSGPTCIIGVARLGNLNAQLFSVCDGAASSSGLQVTLKVGASGEIVVLRQNSVVLAQSPNGLVQAGQYYFYELKTTIDNVVGTVDVRLNGAPVPGLTGLTNLDTQYTTNAGWTGFVLVDGVAFCDLYVNDGSGPAPNNDFWGDTRVDLHLPTADGPTNDWTPSSGSDHYALLDEATPNITDYISTNTLNAVDLVKVQDLVNAGGTIRSVALAILHSKTDAGSCGVTPICRPASTNRPGTQAFPAVGSYLYADHLLPLNPETSAAWSEVEFNACRWGVEKTT